MCTEDKGHGVNMWEIIKGCIWREEQLSDSRFESLKANTVVDRRYVTMWKCFARRITAVRWGWGRKFRACVCVP